MDDGILFNVFSSVKFSGKTKDGRSFSGNRLFIGLSDGAIYEVTDFSGVWAGGSTCRCALTCVRGQLRLRVVG